MKKKVILIVGPSGAGKTRISDYLQNEHNIPRVITHTTRPMREGEVDGQSYYFESNESFAKLHFFEHIKYGDWQYGSSEEGLQRAFENSDLVTLIVDVQGVISYYKKIPDQITILNVITSSTDILKDRLYERGDDPDTIQKRLSKGNMNILPGYLAKDAVTIVNDDWDYTVLCLEKMLKDL
ncbi:MAG: guanylate kinase [Lactobacillus sp.]|nr:guanylate kinase [Lactobacillus sp.]